MLLVKLDSIPDGAYLARPVFNPERPSQPLLQPGSELTSPIVRRLEEMRVPMVWVQGPEGNAAAWETVARPRAAGADQVLSQTGTLLTVLGAQLRKAEKRGAREIKLAQLSGPIRALAAEMSHAVVQEPPVFQLAWGRNDLAGHLANTAYYSLLLATNVPKYLRGQRHITGTELWETLSQLCTAAVLHDVGKLIGPDGPATQVSYEEPNELSYVTADEAYQKHAQRGAEAFRDGLHSAIVYVLANHHQRFNGQGFPRQDVPGGPGELGSLAGTRIHIFARIVALANTIDHLFSHELGPYDAVARLRMLTTLQHKEERIDPVLFNAAILQIPPFPLGTQVVLNDGTPAAVVQNNVDAPCRPRVIPLPAENTLPAPEAAPINLDEVRNLSIAMVAGRRVRTQLYDIPRMSPDPLDYWALKKALSEIPETSAQMVTT